MFPIQNVTIGIEMIGRPRAIDVPESHPSLIVISGGRFIP
jgi:hypothetical protein